MAEPLTEEFLPLKIDPKPDKLVRVLVGRHDVLTPERERKIDALVKRLNGASNTESKAAGRGVEHSWAGTAGPPSRRPRGG